jgi:ubiquinone/menaquinone biosynthesis C-methylase UbiE
MDEREQMEFFHEIFDAGLPRLGPGDDTSTRRALNTALGARSEAGGPRSEKLRILDLGCGNGPQTMQLALNTDGTILAVDNHEPFLDELKKRALALGVEEKIQTCLGDMRNLELDEGPFDLIWCEGALFVTGFRRGLETCFDLLVPGGSLAVTELCWFKTEVPEECRKFFEMEYPPMVDVETNLHEIRECGYELLDTFMLPESAWWDSYYLPLERRLPEFRACYAHDPEKLKFVEIIQLEIDMYRKYSSYYGYVFYIMQR